MNGRIFIEGMEHQGDAIVRLPKGSSFQSLDDEGRFAVDLPRAESFRLRVWPKKKGWMLVEREIEVPSAGPLAPIELQL